MLHSDEESQRAIVLYAKHIQGKYAVEETDTYEGARSVIERKVGGFMSDGSSYDEVMYRRDHVAKRAKSLDDFELIGMHGLIDKTKPRISRNEINGGWAALSSIYIVPAGYLYSGTHLGLAVGAVTLGAGALRLAYSAAINRKVMCGINRALDSAERREQQVETMPNRLDLS